MRELVAALLFGLCLSAPAHAETAARLYASGDFRAAADAGEREGDAAGKLIAARALLALTVGDFRGSETASWLDRAQKNAEDALAASPDSVAARLQLATALGMKGRRSSIKEAMKADYAKRGRALIDQALKLSPREPWAHALLGGWNLEVVRRGGALGSVFMGASVRAGTRAFERAQALAPGDPSIAFHYALALLALDAKRNAGKAGELLQIASTAAPRDAFETNVRESARRIGAILASRGAEAAAQSAAAAFL